MANVSSICVEKMRLMDRAQAILSSLVQLAHEQQAAIRSGPDELIQKVDERIELTMGEKDRALGALRQHGHEHGC